MGETWSHGDTTRLQLKIPIEGSIIRRLVRRNLANRVPYERSLGGGTGSDSHEGYIAISKSVSLVNGESLWEIRY